MEIYQRKDVMKIRNFLAYGLRQDTSEYTVYGVGLVTTYGLNALSGLI